MSRVALSPKGRQQKPATISRNRVADRCCAIASANACSHCSLVRGSHDTWRATCELICNSQNRSMSDGTCSRSRTGHEFIQVPEAAGRISGKESHAVTESSRPGQLRKRREPRWQRALRENGVQRLPSAHKRSRSTPGFRLIVGQRHGADLADAVSSGQFL